MVEEVRSMVSMASGTYINRQHQNPSESAIAVGELAIAFLMTVFVF